MTCIPLVDGFGNRVGMICMAPTAIKLMRGVWMEFHVFHPEAHSEVLPERSPQLF
jgi:hypothetical protein